MSRHRKALEDRIIAEQAAQWLGDLREADEARQEEFVAWLKRSPRHLQEFLYAETVWREVADIPADRVRLEELISRAAVEAELANVIPVVPEVGARAEDVVGDPRRVGTSVLQDQFESGAPGDVVGGHVQQNGASLPGSRVSRVVLAAGLVFAVVGGLVGALVHYNHPSYGTALGEQRSIRLPDGSLMQLNTRSKARVHYSSTAREIELIEGEALFTAQKDAARPFRVRAGQSVIQALGTAFNVYRRQQDTQVAVISGAVQITPVGGNEAARPDATRLDAGQEARITRTGGITLPKSDVADAVAWRERRLVFRGETLENVAAEFNRYNERHIRIKGDAARRKELSGTFDADDAQSLVLFLRRLDDVTVDLSGDDVVIRSVEP